MHIPPRSHSVRSVFGGSLVPVLIVVAALALSTAIFFLFTKKKMEAQKDASAKAAEKTAAVAAAKAAPEAAKTTSPSTPVTPPPAPPPPPPKPAPPAFAFARPLDLGRQLMRSLSTGDFATAGKLASTSDAEQSESVAKLFEKLASMGYKPAGEDQAELLGLVEDRTRIALPFVMPGSQETVRIQLDLERDERMGWKVAKATLPKAMSSAIAAAPMPAPAAPPAASATPGSPATAAAPMKPIFGVDDGTDALAFASDFVRLLLKHDFAAARAYVDEKKVPAERLVGLCIVFEEGQYALNPAKPLIVTIANPEVSWVIAQVQSESLQQNTEFGVELKRADIAQPWKVAGLNLSDILGSFAKSASKLGVPYTPIVKNPKGGESLALYFEYDRAELHPRAQKQLEVISALMKADPSKKLRIAGHTDEKGADDYNIRLSRDRAEAVKKQLAALGVPADQVETTGLGKAQPLSPNKKSDGTDDPEGRSHNRRAEIYLDF
ncbi:OmpA family protein [Prosthecobacter vanneervenii]|uniref:Outer membrane protein OmpA-like peptidoglycan-associated protein n=1 Tax=Prosthecobacter vanneervenii TaxID=48466 RepID=A0A7W7YG85_9BACT|nr:OmpA family protein [Prosthecobacter vanneervenii]MBB5035626.1 outer membrane protein OmpA-like peptidoglycan-associated protein [Prosthecobacter vanneervenii]